MDQVAEAIKMTTTQAATLGNVTTWQVDPAHTHVEFAVKHLMIATVRGRFSDVSGTVIVPDGDFSRAQVEATVSVASVDTREPQRDAHLKSPDFFEVDKYPTMTFRSRRVENASRDTNQYRLIGELTLHGVTKEVALECDARGHRQRPVREQPRRFQRNWKTQSQGLWSGLEPVARDWRRRRGRRSEDLD